MLGFCEVDSGRSVLQRVLRMGQSLSGSCVEMIRAAFSTDGSVMVPETPSGSDAGPADHAR